MGTFLIFRRKIRNVPILLVAVFTLAPLVPVALWSISGEWRFPELWPQAWSLRGFRHLLESATFVGALTDSLWIAAAVAVTSIAVALPAGMAIGGRHFRMKGLVLLIVLLPILVPPLAATLGIHEVFIRLGLADTATGVFLVHLIPAVPYATLILAAAFAGRSGDAESAARTLGAGPIQTFVHVTLPQAAPAIAVAALLAFLISWSQYILTVVIGGGSVITVAVLLFSAATGDDPVIIAALGVVFALPPFVALLITLRLIAARASGISRADTARWTPA
ncbi:MAG TPA: ABC transporter permease subunit [Gammaproteobacteria bacterium]|nr:ABC transporter permease subunit [Gammaproteobacteria bacterium]